MQEIYVQTASFSRELIEDFHGSLEKISKAGYTGLELFNEIYGGYSAAELKDYLDSLGMVAGRTSVLKNRWSAEYLAETGCTVVAGLRSRFIEEAYAAETLNKLGKTHAYGMTYGYHNTTAILMSMRAKGNRHFD